MTNRPTLFGNAILGFAVAITMGLTITPAGDDLSRRTKATAETFLITGGGLDKKTVRLARAL